MNIIQRNFFRLLRSGAFESKEQIEPMSVFKWQKLYQLAVMHDVAGFVYDGLMRCREQFFIHLTDAQWSQWEKTIDSIRKNPRFFVPTISPTPSSTASSSRCSMMRTPTSRAARCC